MNNDDIRRFLLRHRRIMPDTELAKIAGCSEQAIGQFISKSGNRTDGLKFQVNRIHRALGLEVETKVERTRTFSPKPLEWQDGETRLQAWTLTRPKPNGRP